MVFEVTLNLCVKAMVTHGESLTPFAVKAFLLWHSVNSGF